MKSAMFLVLSFLSVYEVCVFIGITTKPPGTHGVVLDPITIVIIWNCLSGKIVCIVIVFN